MEIVIYLLPSILAALFGVLLLMKKFRTLAMSFLILTLFTTAGFYLFDAFVVFRYSDAYFKVISYIFNAYLVPAFPMWMCFTVWSLATNHQTFKPIHLLYILIPLGLFLLELCNYVGLGLDNAADYFAHGRTAPADCTNMQKHLYVVFQFIAIDIYNISSSILLFISFVFMVVQAFRTDMSAKVLYRFLFRRGPIRAVHLLILISFWMDIYFIARIGFQSRYLGVHIPIECALTLFASVGLAAMGWLGFRLHKPAIYLFRSHEEPEFQDLPVAINIPEDLAERNLQSDMHHKLHSEVSHSMREGFENLMRDYQPYLSPGLPRYYIASVLGIRVSGVDHLVRRLYHCSYSTYSMIQRVEYCRRYRALYPNEPLDSIAIACGFSSRKHMLQQWRECQMFFKD